jgi:hypothetical protein
MSPDYTVAWDDALVERYPRCIVCGQAARHIDLAQVSGLVLAVSRCVRCVRKDPEAVQLIARLASREAPRSPTAA